MHLAERPSLVPSNPRLSVALGLAAAASPENLLEMQVLGPYPRPIDSETLGVVPSNLCIIEPSGRLGCSVKFENH